MRLRKFFSCCIALLLCLAISAPAFSAPLTKVRTAWMDEHETFLIWYAKEKGWDKEVGLDIEILYFGSGMAILNALPAGEWVFAGMGAVPAMMGALRYNTYVIGNANEEALINRVLVRPDSPIAKVKGWNKDYPRLSRNREGQDVPDHHGVVRPLCAQRVAARPRAYRKRHRNQEYGSGAGA